MTISKILNWIKKHVWQTVLIVFVFFFFPLIFVHIAYRIPAISPWFASTWNSGELITYIAGFEAFIGTVFLGAVAIHQNDKSNDINARLLKIENDRISIEQQPQILFNSYNVSFLPLSDIFNNKGPVYCCDEVCIYPETIEGFWEKEFYLFTFIMKNLSAFSIRVKLDSLNIKMDPNEETHLNYKTKPFSMYPSSYSIPPQQELIIGFLLDENSFSVRISKQGVFQFKITNSLQDSYVYKQYFLVLPAIGEGYATLLGYSDLSKCVEK